jgi:hypothetical protein
MNIDLDSVLWSTRGYNWGFRFPLQPQKYEKYCQDWLEHYEKMFEQFGDDDNRVVNGYLKIDNKETPFIAIRFKDPEDRNDISGRIIPHEVAIIGDDTQNLRSLNSLELKNAVWTLLSDTYSNIYQASYQDLVEQQEVTDNRLSTFIAKDVQNNWQGSKLKFVVATSVVVVLMVGITCAEILNNLHLHPSIKIPTKK